MKLVEPRISPKPEPESETFDEEYYHSSCGPNPYERNEAWLGFSSIVGRSSAACRRGRSLMQGAPLVCSWRRLDRGIQADGIDVSTYAIANVRPDMREYCRVGSIADPLEGSYDLVTCIEVLEHMPAAEVEAAIRNLTAVTDTILFSSSPDDFDEPTHINVRPPLSWMQLFAQHGFWPDLTYDASFLIPHAMLFRRRAEGLSSDVLISYNERLRARCALARAEQSLRSRDATIEEMKRNAAEAEQSLRSRDATIEELKRNAAEADRSLRSRDATIEELKRNAAEADRSLRSRDTTIEELKRNAAEADATIGRMKRNATKTSQDRDRAQQALRGAKIELQRISVIETSTIWRMTSPLRTIAGHLPKTVRLYGRHAARVVWWLVTPHRIPARLRFLKNRQRLAYSATDTTYAKPADRKVLRSSQSSTKPTAAREEPSQSDASQRDLIASSSLFDAHWYLKQYSDVAAAKFDPALHYLRHGASEGRDPSALFSTRAYLDLYPSVAQSRINPLVHYERDGRKRGLTVIESERGSVKTTADEIVRPPAPPTSCGGNGIHKSANSADPKNVEITCADRREKLLSCLELRATTGVEIGPLANPVVSRDDGRIIYVDHQNAEELRQKYANDPYVDVTKIVNVDAIWGSNTLQEAVGPGVGVDYVVASHVVEHVPDLISWLEELRAVLRPGGTVRLAVPDRRYTFDYLRRESSAVEVLSAYCVRTRIPLPYFIIDSMVNAAQVNVTAAWSDDISPDRLVRHHTIHDAIRTARHAHEEGAYHDEHCWVFTPRSFANLFAELAEIELIRFSCAYFVDTAHNQIEFFVALTPSDDIARMAESWKQMARSVR